MRATTATDEEVIHMAEDNRFDNAEMIGTIQRDGTSIQVRRLEGGEVDVRLYLEGERYEGPTKKGILLSETEVPELVTILGGVLPAKPKARRSKAKAGASA
jgi:hypothetical protein